MKEWTDANNQDGKRPAELKVTLSNGTKVTLNEANAWYAVLTGLPKYNNGQLIEYTWTEDELPEGYELTEVSKFGILTTFTNTHDVEKTEATVKKVWDDANNQDGKRPETLTVALSNGTEEIASVVLSEANNWKATLEGLEKYDGGKEIKYTWAEDEESLPEGYELTGNDTVGTITTLTNSYSTEVTQATVKKVWDDNDNQDGIRPASLTVTLSNGIKTVETIQLDESNGWTATVTDLPKNAAGQLITYTWTEDETGLPEGYKLTGTSKEGTITTLTNSHTPATTEATVRKVWNDEDNQDGKRPERLSVLLSNGLSVDLSDDNDWSATITGLAKFDKGQLITYTWTEDESGLPEGYKLTSTSAAGTITTLTNSYTPEETEATVKKVWNDADNQDGKRPSELKVTLSNGAVVTLNEENGWTATIDKLPKYADGKEIEYTWTEDESGLPEGYNLTGTSVEGTITTLTNSYTPEETEATVVKVWNEIGRAHV